MVGSPTWTTKASVSSQKTSREPARAERRGRGNRVVIVGEFTDYRHDAFYTNRKGCAASKDPIHAAVEVIDRGRLSASWSCSGAPGDGSEGGSRRADRRRSAL